MDRKLYMDIFNMIFDAGRHARDEEQEYLDKLDDSDATINGFYVERLTKAHRKAKKYEDLLKRFEEQVEEPQK